MKLKKLLFLTLLLLITCTGCTIEYNINITEDSVEEIITVNDYITENRTEKEIKKHYNQWYPTFVNYIPEGKETIEIEDYSKKIEWIEYHEKKINPSYNGYEYSYKYLYPLDKYYDSYVLASSFVETTVHSNYNSLVLKTSKESLLCQYDYFDSAKINITIDPKAYKLNYTNTTEIENNTYTWTINKNDCYNSEIILTLDKIENNNNPTLPIDKNNKKDYTIYIFYGILIIIIILGYFIIKKIKEKNENIDLDD